MISKQRNQTIIQVTLVGAIVDFMLAIIKIIIGFLSHSHALIADGIHSFSDLLSDGLVLWVSKYSHSEPDDEHPYGHERFETLATLILAIILLITAILVILDGINIIYQIPVKLILQPWLLTTIVLSILSKEALYWWTRFYGKKIDSSLLKANAWHHRSDAISSIIVLIGVIGTLMGVLYLDAISAIILGLMIAYIAYQLAIPCVKELLDSAIETDISEPLKQQILIQDEIIDIHDFRTRRNGRRVIIDLHIQVNPKLTVSEGHMVALTVEKLVKSTLDSKGVIDIIVHIDPENDKHENRYQHIPTRLQIIKELKAYLANKSCLDELEDVHLHYLNGQVEFDIYFSGECDNDKKQKIQTNINEFINHFSYCKQANFYNKW